MPEVCGRSEYDNIIVIWSKHLKRQNNFELCVKIPTQEHVEENLRAVLEPQMIYTKERT